MHGPEFKVVFVTFFILIIGAFLRSVAAKFRFPYTIGLLLAGLCVGFLVKFGGEGLGFFLAAEELVLSPDLIIFVFLPALIFESSFALDAHVFRRNIGTILTVAGPALLLSTGLTAALMVGLTVGTWQWGWLPALVFGALISATDPVAVVSILRELGVSKKLGVLIEGESLLNDGSSIVVFSVLVALFGSSASLSAGPVLFQFVKVVAGGMLVGMALAMFFSWWMGRTFNDPLIEISLTLALGYLGMVLAEGMLHVSGVIALVYAGIYMSTHGRTSISPEVEHFLHKFWELLAYIANTLIFFLVGVLIASKLNEASFYDFALMGIVYVGITLIRLVIVFGLKPVFPLMGEKVSGREATVIFWGGLRGAVSLALGMVVYQNQAIPLELRQQILLLTTGVVFLTIFINGGTAGAIVKKLGLDKAPLYEQIANLGHHAHVVGSVQRRLDELARSKDLKAVSWGDVRREVDAKASDISNLITETQEQLQHAPEFQKVAGYWLQVLNIERQAYWDTFSKGVIGAKAARVLNSRIDMAIDDIQKEKLQISAEEKTGGFMWKMLHMTGLSKLLSHLQFDQISLRYDIARAQAFASQRVLDALSSFEGMESSTATKIRDAYKHRYLTSKERLEELRTNVPEMTRAIDTRVAKRTVLNGEREEYEHLLHEGVISDVLAAQGIASVEERMKDLYFSSKRVPPPTIADLMAGVDLFKGLDELDQEYLVNNAEELLLSPGDHLCKQGDKGDSLFIVARGVLHVILEKEGKEELLTALGGGEISGEIALLTGQRRSASLKAATTVAVIKIKRESLLTLADHNPGLMDRIWETFAEHRFDSCVRDLPRFKFLSRNERIDWLKQGASKVFREGQKEKLLAPYRYIFVLVGEVGLDGARHGASQLVRADEGEELTALSEVRSIFLPRPPHMA